MEDELRELLTNAMRAPVRGLTEAQTEQIVRRAVLSDGTAWTLLVGAACLALAIVAGLSGIWTGTVRQVALVLAAANLGLSPVAVLALIWRRRYANAV